MELYRRTVLLAGVTVALAGCTSDGNETAGSSPTPETTEFPASETASSPTPAGGTATTTRTDPDLREANVMGVEFAREDDSVQFDVTLYHDDDGEEGYANWWQVETLDGERLGRRDLLHAHGTREFTRSAEIEVPTDVSCVVVRGHDRTHGYGGQAMLANLETGATAKRRQGEEPRSFDGADCP